MDRGLVFRVPFSISVLLVAVASIGCDAGSCDSTKQNRRAGGKTMQLEFSAVLKVIVEDGSMKKYELDNAMKSAFLEALRKSELEGPLQSDSEGNPFTAQPELFVLLILNNERTRKFAVMGLTTIYDEHSKATWRFGFAKELWNLRK